MSAFDELEAQGASDVAELPIGTEAIVELRKPPDTFLGFLLSAPDAGDLQAEANELGAAIADAKAKALLASETAEEFVKKGLALSHAAALEEFGGPEAVVILALDIKSVEVAWFPGAFEQPSALVAAIRFRVTKKVPAAAAAALFGEIAKPPSETVDPDAPILANPASGIIWAAAALAAIAGIGAVAAGWAAEKLVVTVKGASSELGSLAAASTFPILAGALALYLFTR